jgi:hypothetical protein
VKHEPKSPPGRWDRTLALNVTWTMMDKSRLLKGNSHRLRTVLKAALEDRRCLKVHVLIAVLWPIESQHRRIFCVCMADID